MVDRTRRHTRTGAKRKRSSALARRIGAEQCRPCTAGPAEIRKFAAYPARRAPASATHTRGLVASPRVWTPPNAEGREAMAAGRPACGCAPYQQADGRLLVEKRNGKCQAQFLLTIPCRGVRASTSTAYRCTSCNAGSVPRLIISVGRRYVQYIIHTYGRTGALWDSRYKSSFVQAETYVVLCLRYIELNPVRAGVVSDPGEYPWSSYRANALGHANPILSPHPLYLALAAEDAPRRNAYGARFRSALYEAPLADRRMAPNQDQPSGTVASPRKLKPRPPSAASYGSEDTDDSGKKMRQFDEKFRQVPIGSACFQVVEFPPNRKHLRPTRS